MFICASSIVWALLGTSLRDIGQYAKHLSVYKIFVWENCLISIVHVHCFPNSSITLGSGKFLLERRRSQKGAASFSFIIWYLSEPFLVVIIYVSRKWQFGLMNEWMDGFPGCMCVSFLFEQKLSLQYKTMEKHKKEL